MFQLDITACCVLLTVHLLQGIYLRHQLKEVEKDGEQVVCEDLQTAQRINIIRDPMYFTGSYLVLFSLTLLVALAWAPLAVGFSAYAVVTWRPFQFQTVYEEEEDLQEAHYPDED